MEIYTGLVANWTVDLEHVMNKIIAIASGKGGVGKSTVAANIAVALANEELGMSSRAYKVALIDIDFYGPSIPTLMGGGEIKVDGDERFIPAFRHGVKYISLAFFLPKKDDPVIWRGPMFGKGITQLFGDVTWGDIDVCIVDLPPGTGDAQLSLSQLVQLAGVVVVTTPQEVALSDVRRAINMFKKVDVPVLGLIENMSGFVAPNGECFDIFGTGGGEELERTYGIPLIGKIPLDISIREGGDNGVPCVVDGSDAARDSYRKIIQQLEPLIASSGVSKVVIEN